MRDLRAQNWGLTQFTGLITRFFTKVKDIKKLKSIEREFEVLTGQCKLDINSRSGREQFLELIKF